MLVTVKEWLKSILNYRSYPKNKTGPPFFGPPCSHTKTDSLVTDERRMAAYRTCFNKRQMTGCHVQRFRRLRVRFPRRVRAGRLLVELGYQLAVAQVEIAGAVDRWHRRAAAVRSPLTKLHRARQLDRVRAPKQLR